MGRPMLPRPMKPIRSMLPRRCGDEEVGWIDGAPPEHAIADDGESLGRSGDIQCRRDATLGMQFREQSLEAVGDVAVEALEDLADARIACGLQTDLDAHAVAVRGLLEKVLLAQRPQGLQKIGGGGQGIEALGKLLPVALADACDQRFLAVEIDVERAGADGSLLADVVHGGAVEAGATEALLGGVENVLTPGALDVGLELGHRRPSFPARAALRLGRSGPATTALSSQRTK